MRRPALLVGIAIVICATIDLAQTGNEVSFVNEGAINAPIQGSAADIIRRAMIRMPHALHAAGLDGVRMLLQVHDELIFEAEDRLVDKALKVIAGVMEKAPEPTLRLSVPVHVDVKAAENWEAAH